MVNWLKSILFHNHSNKQIFFKNTFWLGLIEFFSKIIMFFVTILIVRSFGPTNFGKFNLAFSYAAIFILFSDFGLDTIVTREIARNPNFIHKYLSNSLSIKIIVSLLIVIISFFARPLLNGDPFIQKLFFLCISYSLIQNIYSLFTSVFSGLEKMEFIFISRLIYYLGILFSAILITTNNSTPDKLLLLYMLISIITLSATAILLIINKVKIYLEFDFVFWKKILKETFPLFGLAVISTIYLNNDTILIGRFFGPENVGFYQSAYKILFAFQSVNIINLALFPRFSALIHQKNYTSLNKLIRLTLLLSFVVLMPLGLGISIFANQIMKIIYGTVYVPASPALIFLIWSGIIFYFRNFINNLLIANNKQKQVFYSILLGTTINVMFNLFITPSFNYIYASMAMVLSEIIILIYSIIRYVKTK